MEEEAPELISPRISFSHDLVVVATPPPPAAAALAVAGRRSDASLPLVWSSRSRSRARLPEPDFDFANAVAADVAPADRLFAGGKLLPMPPLPPPAPIPCKPQQAPCRVKAQQQQISRRPGSWPYSPFSRSSSVNDSATTTTTAGAPRSAGRFGCPPFPLMRSWSVGSAAAVARDGAAAAAGHHHRPHQHHHHQYYKKFGGAAAATGNGAGGGSRAYYYGGGGSRKGSSSGSGGSHGVRVRPVLNVPFIGTSVSSVLSYLLCDCSSQRTKKSRGEF